MELTWVRAIHIAGVVAWIGGLAVLTALLARHAAARATIAAPVTEARTARERKLYRWLVAPSLFVALFTGIWLLHHQPALLEQPFVHAKLVVVALLLVVDHGAMRGIEAIALGGEGWQGRPIAFRALTAALLTLAIAAVIMILVRPWDRG